MPLFTKLAPERMCREIAATRRRVTRDGFSLLALGDQATQPAGASVPS